MLVKDPRLKICYKCILYVTGYNTSDSFDKHFKYYSRIVADAKNMLLKDTNNSLFTHVVYQ